MEKMSESQYYYQPQERAFAPGIVKEWPEVIPHPTDGNGRLIRKEGDVEQLQAENDRLKELLSAYRDKRAVDGLNGRRWDSGPHLAANDRIDRFEQALKNKGGGRTDKGVDTESD